MFAQKFSRNKVELRVRCLPRPLCHSASPHPLPCMLCRKTFPTLFAILAEFVSARSRRKPLGKRKSSGKITKKRNKKFYKPFCILFRFRLDPDLDTVSDPSPPPPTIKSTSWPRPLLPLPTAVMRFHFTVTGSVHGKLSAFITEF